MRFSPFPEDALERLHPAPSAGLSHERRTIVRACIWLAAGYCVAIILLTTVMRGVLGGERYELTAARIMLFAFAPVLIILVSLALLWSRSRNLRTMAVQSIALSLGAASIFGLMDQSLNVYELQQAAFDVRDFSYNMLYGSALVFGWCCLFVAYLFSADLMERERRMHAWREEAMHAQMRALRYQINPHFLFNTMNSVAGLMEEQAVDQARTMLLSLSSYLRATLTLDPSADIPLEEEVAMQQRYLDIERERFSDRMQVVIDVPPSLGKALVPALVLQPLVENAVKHGVCSMPGRAEISVSASVVQDQLLLVVENDFRPSSDRISQGTGIGLRNVRERIGLHFPAKAALTTQIVHEGRRFRVTVCLPLRWG